MESDAGFILFIVGKLYSDVFKFVVIVKLPAFM